MRMWSITNYDRSLTQLWSSTKSKTGRDIKKYKNRLIEGKLGTCSYLTGICSS